MAIIRQQEKELLEFYLKEREAAAQAKHREKQNILKKGKELQSCHLAQVVKKIFFFFYKET